MQTTYCFLSFKGISSNNLSFVEIPAKNGNERVLVWNNIN